MMTNFLKILALIPLLTVVLLMAGYSHSSAFDLFGNSCTGQAANSPACQQASSQGGDNTNRVTGNGNIIQDAANVIALVTGVAAIIMIIISALTYVGSGGSAETVTASRRRLVAAIIGLFIVALAWTITRFITDRLIK